MALHRVRSKRDKCYEAAGLSSGGSKRTAAGNAVEDAVVEAVLAEVVTEALTLGVPFIGGAIVVARLDGMYQKVVQAVAEVATTLYTTWMMDKLKHL